MAERTCFVLTGACQVFSSLEEAREAWKVLRKANEISDYAEIIVYKEAIVYKEVGFHWADDQLADHIGMVKREEDRVYQEQVILDREEDQLDCEYAGPPE